MTAGPEPSLQRLEATIHGRVQGVGFRYHVCRVAASLQVSGWVANQRDGSVAVVAEGSPDSLDRLEAVLREGPDGARVDRIEGRRVGGEGRFDGFRARSGSHAGD